MPRRQRVCPPGQVFHVLNRAVARLTLFEKPEDYEAWLRVLEETWEITPLPILAMVVMPNHGRFVVRPNKAVRPSAIRIDRDRALRGSACNPRSVLAAVPRKRPDPFCPARATSTYLEEQPNSILRGGRHGVKLILQFRSPNSISRR
jgi:hypothetical protein